jgi:hypothetical protein
MPAAAPSSPDPNCSLPATFVVLALVVDVLVAPLADEPLIVNVLAAPLANEPPVAEEVEVLRANIAEILLVCAASIPAPHGLLGPSCGHPVQLATMSICPAQSRTTARKTWRSSATLHSKADGTLSRDPASDVEDITTWSADARFVRPAESPISRLATGCNYT